jgi:hypothetical protein
MATVQGRDERKSRNEEEGQVLDLECIILGKMYMNSSRFLVLGMECYEA